jgi:hypothetical protein
MIILVFVVLLLQCRFDIDVRFRIFIQIVSRPSTLPRYRVRGKGREKEAAEQVPS